MTEVLRGFPPIIDAAASTLILGSFPSEASLAAQQYYGHGQNQFWRLLAALLAIPLAEMAYPDRKAALHRAGVAVWDVFASCQRAGSLDSAIRGAQANDFGKLKKLAPKLRRVCFNGQAAARFAHHIEELGYETAVLPSSSPAYTLAFEKKLAAWRAVLGS
ncbi:MAG: DNA-deoxyinosine glycosylase [Sterolibacterium sp.]|jgi:hypoxanthine-DNA glycosylase